MEQNEQAVNQTPQTTSLTTRITNVFTSPNELFDELKVSPVKSSSWVVPLLLGMFLAVFIVFAMYYNDSLREKIFEMQEQKIQERVDEGKIPQEQADQYVEGMRKSGPVMFVAIGGISALIMTIIMFFAVALVFWLVMKLGFKFTSGYKKVLEFYGLASMIGIFGGVITLLMMYLFDTMFASPSLGIMFINDYDVNNKLHLLMSQVNLFTIWQIGVIGFGVAKLSEKSTGTGLSISFGLWTLWVIISVFLGIGIR